MPSSPRPFAVRCLLFAGLALALAHGLDAMIGAGLRRSRSAEFHEWNAIVAGRIDADCIVLGSSAAVRDVSPLILDEILGTRSHNFGIDGRHLPMQLCRYRLYRSRHPAPRLVLLIVGPPTLAADIDFRRAQVAPYLDEPVVRAHVREQGLFHPLALYLPMLAYAGETQIMLTGLLEFVGLPRPSEGKIRGYLPMDATWEEWYGANPDQVFHFEGRRPYVPLPATVEALRRFLAKTRREGTKAVLVRGPLHESMAERVSNLPETLALYRRIARETETPMLDYSAHPLTRSRRWFYNVTHLNRRGAERFTRILAEDLKALGLARSDARPTR